MATPTPNLGLARPDDGDTSWGDAYRSAMDTLDAEVGALRAASEGGVPQDTRFEWQTVAGESVPAYIGKADPDTPTNAATWTIKRFFWAIDAQGAASLDRIETEIGSWDDRATLF